METNKNVTQLDGEKLMLVAHNLVDELKDLNKTVANVVSTTNHLSGKVSGFNEKLETIQITAPPVDTQKFRDLLTKHMLTIASIVDKQPKVKIWKLKILPMPLQHSKLFFKVILGCFLCGSVAVAISDTYQWFRFEELNKTRVEIEKERIKADKIIRSWNYLYNQKDKKMRRQMDSALKKVQVYN